jgi:uncharacterized protein (TIGR03437 family)
MYKFWFINGKASQHHPGEKKDMKVEFVRVWAVRALMVLALTTAAWSGTFGKVIPIGGQASDIVLDEGRGVLYIANFTANTIDVMSLADNTISTSFNVAPQPGSLALSPDGQYLVVAHFGNFSGAPANAITVINLAAGNARQTFALGFPPLGVAFGIDGQCFVVTTTNFMLLDPVTGATTSLDTVANVSAKTLPVTGATFPPQIISASLNTSSDGLWIYGLTDTITFSYDVRNKTVKSQSYISSPPMGPRVMSVSDDGSFFVGGWALQGRSGLLLQEFPSPIGLLNVGSHALDSRANVIYAEIPSSASSTTTTLPVGTPPATSGTFSGPAILGIYDADNLTLREQLVLQEHLAGKSLLTGARDVMYSISDSGLTVLPVGALKQAHRVRAEQEDIVFRGNFCNRAVATQTLTITDPGGGHTEFSLSVNGAGIALSPSAGVTPATVTVAVDPGVYANQKGTSVATISIKSASAVNIPSTVRVLINTKDPDQRGTFIDIPGKLVDLLADPSRNRYYVLRQDKNQVLVFDGTSNQQLATLRTGNTPTMMALTFDNQYLLIGHDDSQVVYVYESSSLKPQIPIAMPFGHYPRSLASSGNAILAAVRSATGPHAIDRIDLPSRTASILPSLGIFNNSVNVNTVLTASPNGANILVASADGSVMLYDANADTFVASRKDLTGLTGSYAASSFGQFIVDNNLLNASLVPIKKFDTSTGSSSGFAFIDQGAYRTTASSASGPGIVQRVDLVTGGNILPTRMVEAPLTGSKDFSFVRTLAPMASRTSFVSLTQSGVTVLPWNYDAAVAPPSISQLVNAADQTSPVAPGALINVMGTNLSPVNVATNEVPLPTALADSCLTVNGIPVPMLLVSSSQINAQLPYNVDGNATMVLRTPGGVSDNYLFSILPAAPSVFRNGIAGPETGIPTILRAENNELVTPTNPIHPGDTITIYATGLGRTTPNIDAGVPAPSDPLPSALIKPVVTLGGSQLIMTYAGLAPGQIGVYQINAIVPKGGVPEGMPIPLVIKQGASQTQIDVRVVK